MSVADTAGTTVVEAAAPVVDEAAAVRTIADTASTVTPRSMGVVVSVGVVQGAALPLDTSYTP